MRHRPSSSLRTHKLALLGSLRPFARWPLPRHPLGCLARQLWQRVTLRVLAWTLPALAISCQGDPQNYDDCILRHVKPGMNQAAVAVVMRSCREKFPADSAGGTAHGPTERTLNPSELAALTGRAALAYGNRYSGTLYNGNAALTLTEVEISISTTVDGKEVTRLYRTNVSVPPQTAADFEFDIVVGDKGADYSWTIASAKAGPKK